MRCIQLLHNTRTWWTSVLTRPTKGATKWQGRTATEKWESIVHSGITWFWKLPLLYCPIIICNSLSCVLLDWSHVRLLQSPCYKTRCSICFVQERRLSLSSSRKWLKGLDRRRDPQSCKRWWKQSKSLWLCWWFCTPQWRGKYPQVWGGPCHSQWCLLLIDKYQKHVQPLLPPLIHVSNTDCVTCRFTTYTTPESLSPSHFGSVSPPKAFSRGIVVTYLLSCTASLCCFPVSPFLPIWHTSAVVFFAIVFIPAWSSPPLPACVKILPTDSNLLGMLHYWSKVIWLTSTA